MSNVKMNLTYITQEDIKIIVNNTQSYMEVLTFHDKINALTDMHYDLELFIVISGSIKVMTNENCYELESGQVWFNNMWEPHSFELIEIPTKILILGINPSTLNNIYLGEDFNLNFLKLFTTPINNRAQLNNDHDRTELIELISVYEKILRTKNKLLHQQERIMILQILSLIISKCDYINDSDQNQPFKQNKINNALELVLNNKRFVTVEEAARSCGMNIISFNSSFKNLMGINFSSFALMHRLKGAARSLNNKENSIKEIVYTWGFTDASHFYRNFKKYFGCTPREYRSRLIKS